MTDNTTGVAGASLTTDVGVGGQLRLRSGTHRDGIWVGRLTIPRWRRTRSMTYPLMFGATDRPGNEQLVGSEDLARRGMPASSPCPHATRTETTRS